MSLETQEISPIQKEVERFKKQIDEIQDALDSVKLDSIADDEAKLKAIINKQAAMLKLPQLLSMYEALITQAKKLGEIKGNKNLSPLESGLLD